MIHLLGIKMTFDNTTPQAAISNLVYHYCSGIKGPLLAMVQRGKSVVMKNPSQLNFGLINMTVDVANKISDIELYKDVLPKAALLETDSSIVVYDGVYQATLGYMFGFDCEYLDASGGYSCSVANITHLGKGVPFNDSAEEVSTASLPSIISISSSPLNAANEALKTITDEDFKSDFNVAHNLNINTQALGSLTIDKQSIGISRVMGVWINSKDSLLNKRNTKSYIQGIYDLAKIAQGHEDSEVYESDTVYLLEILPCALINVLCLTYEPVLDEYYIRKVTDSDVTQVPKLFIQCRMKVCDESFHHLCSTMDKEISSSVSELMTQVYYKHNPSIKEEEELKQSFDVESDGNLITFAASRKS